MTQLQKHTGRIAQFRPVQGGYLFTLAVFKKTGFKPHCEYLQIAIFGDKAKALAAKAGTGCHKAFSVGQRFTFQVFESTVTRNGRSYKNLRVDQWAYHPEPKRQTTPSWKIEPCAPTEKRDDDWFVPDVRPDHFTPFERRYEGSSQGGRS